MAHLLNCNMKSTYMPGGFMSLTTVQGVVSISELRTLSPVVEQKLEILGHSSINDGGGGLFVYDNLSVEADNNGTIIKPNSVSGAGRWKRIWTEIYPEMFGAKGDAVTDDYAAFANAVTAIPNGSTLRATRGKTYRVTQAIQIAKSIKVYLAGSLFVAANLPAIAGHDGCGIFSILGTSSQFTDGVYILGGTFSITATSSKVCAVFAVYAQNVNVSEIICSGHTYPGVFGRAVRNVRIDRNKFYSGLVGIQFISYNSIACEDIWVQDNLVENGTAYQGIDIEALDPISNSSVTIKRVWVVGNKVVSTPVECINIFGVDGAVVANNYVRGSSRDGIVLTGSQRVKLVANLSESNNWYGIRIYGGSDNLIQGNETRSNTQGSMIIDSTPSIVSRLSISANKFNEGRWRKEPSGPYPTAISGFPRARKGQLTPPLGLANSFGQTQFLSILQNIFIPIKIKIAFGGTFSSETIAVRFYVTYDDGTSTNPIGDKSSSGSNIVWLSDDEILALVKDSANIIEIGVAATTTRSGSSGATVSITLFGLDS
jgi:parallel beta-helix repeat protein